MPVPDFQTLMLPLLRALASGKPGVKDCLPDLAEGLGLTEEEVRATIKSGNQTVLYNRAQWARTYMAKAGLLDSPRRGISVVTDLGRSVLAENPDRIDNALLMRFGSFERWRETSRRPRGAPQAEDPAGPIPVFFAEGDIETPHERIAASVLALENELADDLLQRLLRGTPDFFERAVLDLLVAMGYGRGREGAGRRLGRSGDGGVDGVIGEDALGLDAVYVQAKRYAPENTIGRPAIQQFVGSLTSEGAMKGVFVTTSAFSREAEDYVRRIAQRIVLIDGPRFARLMIAHGVGVRSVETITLSEIDENFFSED